ncbi:NAD-dependent epimerase/dehydratase family protein [Aestuariibius sp. 2305UL40-4]|uniref:NAD-dependent epimerase/dehydratase family protein n=1 Tax=Aestuariibius violaceus TaxID=3234132 RepID=UPI00398F0B46
MRQVLIAGGAGFIGAHLVRAILARGDRVTVIDNFQTGRREALDGLKVAVIEHDLVQPLRTAPGRFDLVFNLACPASPRHYQANPLGTLRCNFVGTDSLLSLALSSGARMVQASTSEVYGDPEVHPQPEGYPGSVNPTGPRACYDEGKRAAETLCAEYHRQHGLDVRMARIFNTYGPGMISGDGRAVPAFIAAALEGREIPVQGTGKQTRSLCYVSDTVAGLLALADGEGLAGEVFNIGNPDEITILKLASAVASACGRPDLAIRFEAAAVDDPRRRCPDIGKAQRVLNWAPRIGLEDGLRRTVAAFRESARLMASVS